MTAMLPRRSSAQIPPDESATIGLFGPVTQLSAFASELAELPLGPSGAFREELRSRLMAEAGRALSGTAPAILPADPDRRQQHTRHRHTRRAAAAGLAVVLAGGGVAAASAGRSLPGEPLYPLKKFEQSVRLALDPAAGTGPSIRLISDRITEAERTVTADPRGTDAARWNAVDTSLAEADRTLAGLTGSAPAAELGSSLSPDRERVQNLLSTVPAAHRPVVQQLLDTIDGLSLPLPPVSALSALPLFGLLPPGRLAPEGALAQGWPIDPALLSGPPTLPGVPGTAPGDSITAPAAGAFSGATGASSSNTSGATGSGSAPSGSGSSGAARSTSPSGRLPSLPLGSGTSSGTGTRTSTPPGGVLPPVSGTVTGTVGGLVGGVGSTVGRTAGGATDGSGGGGSTHAPTVGSTLGGVVEDGTDSLRHLPRLGTVSSFTTSR